MASYDKCWRGFFFIVVVFFCGVGVFLFVVWLNRLIVSPVFRVVTIGGGAGRLGRPLPTRSMYPGGREKRWCNQRHNKRDTGLVCCCCRYCTNTQTRTVLASQVPGKMSDNDESGGEKVRLCLRVILVC